MKSLTLEVDCTHMATNNSIAAWICILKKKHVGVVLKQCCFAQKHCFDEGSWSLHGSYCRCYSHLKQILFFIVELFFTFDQNLLSNSMIKLEMKWKSDALFSAWSCVSFKFFIYLVIKITYTSRVSQRNNLSKTRKLNHKKSAVKVAIFFACRNFAPEFNVN